LRAQAQFVQEVGPVHFHSSRTDAQAFCNGRTGVAFGDELQDLALARGERFVHVLTCRRALRVGFDGAF